MSNLLIISGITKEQWDEALKARGNTGDDYSKAMVLAPIDNALDILHRLAKSEINYQIQYFFDEGYTVKLGDPVNGFKATSPLCDDFGEVADWLIEQIEIHYPDSDFAKTWKGLSA